MIDDSDRLKPCPFCGGVPQSVPTSNGARFIECTKCHASTSLMYSTGEDCAPILAEKWNKRALLTSDFGEDVRKFSHHMDDRGQGITERQVYDLATELRGILERYRCLR
jgi:Lar family restriction alleviation protein